MQIVKYKVRLIQSNGMVLDVPGLASFIDSVPVKRVREFLGEEHQRDPANVLVTESHRESV